MRERFCEKDYSRTQEGKLVERDPEAGGKKRGQGHQKRFGEERECVYLWGGQRCWKRLCKNEATGKLGNQNVRRFKLAFSFGQGLSFFSDQNREGECCASSGAEGIQADGGGGTRRCENQDWLVALASGLLMMSRFILNCSCHCFKFSAVDLDRPQNIFLLQS